MFVKKFPKKQKKKSKKAVSILLAVLLILQIISGVLFAPPIKQVQAATIADDTQAEFDAGAYNETQWDATNNWVELTATGQTNGSGDYTSNIKDLGTSQYNSIAWAPERPTGKELPDNAASETAYNFGNANMTGNTLLMHMNDNVSGAGQTISDTSGQGNNGTTFGNTDCTVSAKLNKGCSFDGDGDYITLPDNSSLSPGAGDFAINMWFKTSTDFSESGRMYSDTGSGSNQIYVLMQSVDETIATGWIDAEGDNAGTITISSLNDGVWHMLTTVRDGTTNSVYVDGVFENSATNAALGTIDVTGGDLAAIGKIASSESQFFNGLIDEVATWNRTLSPIEILDIYKRGALGLKFQVRSCNDDACDGESFAGPNASITDYYSESNNNSTSTPSFSLTDINNNRYFQYKAFLETASSTLSSELKSINIDYTEGAQVTNNWHLTTPSNYTFDNTLIEIVSSISQLKGISNNYGVAATNGYFGGIPVALMQYDRAIHYQGVYDRTYIVFGGNDVSVNEPHPMITYYDHDSGTYATPVRIGTNSTLNEHGNPTMAIDDDGYIYVFYAAFESTGMKMKRSTNPEDITAWGAEIEPEPAASVYPTPLFINKSGVETLFLFYRTGETDRDFVYRTSTDNGSTWSVTTTIFAEEDRWAYHPGYTIKGNESPTESLQTAFTTYYNSDGTYHNVYYAASYDGGDTWQKADGTNISLPMTTSNVDLVYTGGVRGFINDIQLDNNNSPYILFSGNETKFLASDVYPVTHKLAYWNGSSWVVKELPMDRHWQDHGTLRVINSSYFKVYLPSAYAGEIEEWTSTDGGDTWTNTLDLTSNSTNANQFVRPILEQSSYKATNKKDLQILWSYGGAFPVEVLGWGENSFYSTNTPTIQPTAANSLTFASLSAFTETATKNSGEIKYILSNDDGTSWQYYNSGWTTSDETYSQANTAIEVNTNIATFPTGNGDFLFKAFLNSDGSQLVQLDNVEVAYNTLAALASNITGADDPVYAGVEYSLTAVYSDAGYADLADLYLKIDHDTATDIEIHFTEAGATGSGSVTVDSGSVYLIGTPTYSYTSSGNDITATFTFTLDWDWTESTLIEYAVKAINDSAADSGYDSTNIDVLYENDLTFSGTLAASGSVQGSLSSGDWVQGSESISWSGLTVVYQGTTTSPAEADFDIRVSDDDGTTWDQLTGSTLATTTTADATTDTEDVHTVSIINIPTGGSDVSSQTFTIKVDADAPTSVGAPTFGAIATSSIVVNKPSTVTETGSGLNQWQARRGGSTTLGLQATTTTSDTDSSLSANTQYAYDVQFTDMVGNTSSYGTSANKYTSANVPTTAGHTNQTTSALRFTWSSGGAQTDYAYGTDSTCAVGTTTNAYLDLSSLSANTQYTRYACARNGDQATTTSLTLQAYTSADTPATPTVGNQASTTLDVNPVTGGSESSLAIYAEQGGSCNGIGGLGYVQTDGSISGSAIWQTDAVWDTVTGLSAGTQYSFCSKARNGDNDETSFGSAGSGTTNTIPSATFDNDFSTWESGSVTVNYNLIDADSDISNISQSASSGIEYSTDNSTWFDATDAGGASEGLTGLSSSASPGADHIFIWNSATDLASTEDSTVYLRLRPNDGIDNASSWTTSNAFGLDNVAPSSVGAPTFGTIATSSIVVNKPSVVTEAGSGLNQWQARRDGTTTLGLQATTTTSDTDSSLSENTQYAYSVQFTDNQSNASAYGATSTKYTLADTPTNLSLTAQSTTTINTSVDTFPNHSSGSSGYYFSNR